MKLLIAGQKPQYISDVRDKMPQKFFPSDAVPPIPPRPPRFAHLLPTGTVSSSSSTSLSAATGSATSPTTGIPAGINRPNSLSPAVAISPLGTSVQQPSKFDFSQAATMRMMNGNSGSAATASSAVPSGVSAAPSGVSAVASGISTAQNDASSPPPAVPPRPARTSSPPINGNSASQSPPPLPPRGSANIPPARPAPR